MHTKQKSEIQNLQLFKKNRTNILQKFLINWNIKNPFQLSNFSRKKTKFLWMKEHKVSDFFFFNIASKVLSSITKKYFSTLSENQNSIWIKTMVSASVCDLKQIVGGKHNFLKKL